MLKQQQHARQQPRQHQNRPRCCPRCSHERLDLGGYASPCGTPSGRSLRSVSTSDVTLLFEAAAATFRSVLSGVQPEHHRRPTPCEPLDVGDLVAKAVGHQNWVRAAIEGSSDPPSYPPIEPDHWMAAFDESTASMLTELRRDGVMDRRVTLAAGLTFPGADVALLAARNIVQFAWDLAVGSGHSRERLVPQRGPGGFFGPEFGAARGITCCDRQQRPHRGPNGNRTTDLPHTARGAVVVFGRYGLLGA
jgi:uncharacterized protein (TIGR03086 family)